jgi:hypothetical protein
LTLKEELENKSAAAIHEEIMIFLEVFDATKYRKKIKGFHMAFNIRDKN